MNLIYSDIDWFPFISSFAPQLTPQTRSRKDFTIKDLEIFLTSYKMEPKFLITTWDGTGEEDIQETGRKSEEAQREVVTALKAYAKFEGLE